MSRTILARDQTQVKVETCPKIPLPGINTGVTHKMDKYAAPALDRRPSAKRVTILGTGNFGVAIARRLILAGYEVTFGSRRASARNLAEMEPTLASAQVSAIYQAIRANDIIIFAIRVANFHKVVTEYGFALTGKILIDVSNRSKSSKVMTSNAEILQMLLPDCTVVKAFNVISAYSMTTDLQETSRMVPVASDNCQARVLVKNIARDLGFQAFDAGSLKASRQLEMSVITIFPMWRLPLLSGLAIFMSCWVYIIYIYYIRDTPFQWEQIFVKMFNKSVCMTAVSMFALTYLPGCLASIYQLNSGTKYKRFPAWLDRWMKCRKQFGLVAFALVSVHALLSALTLSPTYYRSWFHKYEVIIPANMTSDVHLLLPVTSWMTWKGELSCLTGALALTVFCLLAITSQHSVGNTLNWAEWRLIQSRFGCAGLMLALAHILIMGVPAWKENFSWLRLLRSVTFMSCILPATALLLRLILALPPFSSQLRRIRRGWESDTRTDNEQGDGDALVSEKQDPLRTPSQNPLEKQSANVVNKEQAHGKRCFCMNNGQSVTCCDQSTRRIGPTKTQNLYCSQEEMVALV